MSKFSRRQILGGAGSALLAGTAGLDDAAAAPILSNLHADVCVVGAGFAGLTAAYRLKQAGAKVVMLEARRRVGGRSWTRSMSDGGWVDWGGQWIGDEQKRFHALIREMGCRTYPSPGVGYKDVQRGVPVRSGLLRIESEQDFPGKRQTEDLYALIGKLARKIDPHRPWRSHRAQELDGVTFAQWLRDQKGFDPVVRQYVGVELGSVPSASPEEISMLQLGWLIRSCHGLGQLFGYEDGAQKDRLIGGTQQAAQQVASRLGNDIKLGQPVRRIELKRDGTALVQSDKLSVAARHVVVAIPPHLAGAIEYEPSLPTSRVQVTQRWPQGLVIKVSMVYSEPFWRKDDGLSGKSFDYTALMSETADSSNPEKYSKAGILTGFVYAESARKAVALSAEARKKVLLAEVAQRFGKKALNPVHYHESNWSTQPWTRGCFTGFLTPGATVLFGAAVREPVGPLHWAGTETATDWPSFIEGAVQSGERAAAEIRKA